MFKEIPNKSLNKNDIKIIKDWIKNYWEDAKVDIKNKKIFVKTFDNDFFIKEFNNKFENKRNTNYKAILKKDYVIIS